MERGTSVIEKALCGLLLKKSRAESVWTAILASLIIVTDPPTAFFCPCGLSTEAVQFMLGSFCVLCCN